MATESPDPRSLKERYAPYVEAWRRRLAAQREADEAGRARALEEARRAAKILAERYGVTRVILFGSLAWRRFHPTSDIDLAVEGLAPARFFRADAELAREIPLPVDLKLLSECPPPLRSRIEEEGGPSMRDERSFLTLAAEIQSESSGTAAVTRYSEGVATKAPAAMVALRFRKISG